MCPKYFFYIFFHNRTHIIQRANFFLFKYKMYVSGIHEYIFYLLKTCAYCLCVTKILILFVRIYVFMYVNMIQYKLNKLYSIL